MKKILITLLFLLMAGCSTPDGGIPLPKWSGVINTDNGPIVIRDGR